MVTYERMKRAEAPLMHLSAVAGSGKTFLAVQMVIETLKDTAGQILFVAPSLPLCFHFIRWLGRRGSHENISFPSLLDRVVVLTPTMNFMKLVVQGRSLVTISDKTLCNTQYDLTVVDEAHDIYRRDVLETGFLEKVKTKRWLLLSNLSQSSDLTPCFPENATEGRLTEVVRSTKRIVAGAAAFHATPDDKEGLGSLCPVGPPVKTFLFKAATADAVKGYGKYVDHTISAIRFIVHSNPSLNLHHRLALLAPDDDFCKSFEPSLALALAYGFEKRRFSFTTFQESMSILPLDLLEAEELDSEDYEEVIILDSGKCERTGTAVRDLHQLGFRDQLLEEWCHHQSKYLSSSHKSATSSGGSQPSCERWLAWVLGFYRFTSTEVRWTRSIRRNDGSCSVWDHFKGQFQTESYWFTGEQVRWTHSIRRNEGSCSVWDHFKGKAEEEEARRCHKTESDTGSGKGDLFHMGH